MKQNQKRAWLFLAPTIIFVTGFSIFPILRAFVMSFQGGPLIALDWTGFSNYQYIFKEDGQVTMQVKQHYYADGKDMTLSDHAGSTDYIYERSEDSLVLKNTQEEPVLTLVKVEK